MILNFLILDRTQGFLPAEKCPSAVHGAALNPKLNKEDVPVSFSRDKLQIFLLLKPK